jgi:hypothetical protein
MIKTKWYFTDARNTAVFTTLDIIEEVAPILLVTHNQDDGSWQFFTGKTIADSEAKIVALDEIIVRDLSIIDLSDLPLGWSADRDSCTSPWKRKPISSGA